MKKVIYDGGRDSLAQMAQQFIELESELSKCGGLCTLNN